MVVKFHFMCTLSAALELRQTNSAMCKDLLNQFTLQLFDFRLSGLLFAQIAARCSQRHDAPKAWILTLALNKL